MKLSGCQVDAVGSTAPDGTAIFCTALAKMLRCHFIRSPFGLLFFVVGGLVVVVVVLEVRVRRKTGGTRVRRKTVRRMYQCMCIYIYMLVYVCVCVYAFRYTCLHVASYIYI